MVYQSLFFVQTKDAHCGALVLQTGAENGWPPALEAWSLRMLDASTLEGLCADLS